MDWTGKDERNEYVETYHDERNEIDPVPEGMRVLDVVHYVDPTSQTDHLPTTRYTVKDVDLFTNLVGFSSCPSLSLSFP